MEALFPGESLAATISIGLAWLFNDVFTPANVVHTAMQIPTLVGTGFFAWWVHDFVYPPLVQRVAASGATDYSKGVLGTLLTLIFPVLWSAFLGIALSLAVAFEWPLQILIIAINLLVAWIIIRLASILVREPIWSRTIAIVAYAIAALNILDLIGPAAVLLDQMAINIGQVRISALAVLKGMISLAILLWAAMLVSKLLERRLQRIPNLTPTIQVLFGKLLKITLVLIAITVSLTTVGIDLTAIAVFAGGLGVGIGFGLQKVVSNLISGIILLMDKSIKPGDIIQISGTYGWVSSLGARYVAVQTRDSTEFLIPNEDVITHQLINWSHNDDLARIKVQVRVTYHTDVRKALDLMVEAAGKPRRVQRKPAPRALMLGFGDSGIDLELRFWIRDVQNGIRNISSDVMLEMWDLFRAHDIAVPLPQRVVHLHGAASGLVNEEETAIPSPSGMCIGDGAELFPNVRD
jgi:small-conductance mechanosensitive channel